MDVEELTKSQIILLVLLVSFVTSIATGIVTVSLLAQAPPAVTQTVNRIVERTVETVVPSNNQQASVVTKEVTVVVKEDDLITESINNGFKGIVRIHEGNSTSTPIIALGAITGSGTIVTDYAMVDGEHTVLYDDEAFQYEVTAEFPKIGISFMTAIDDAPDGKVFKGADVESVKLGQTMIGLYGARSDRVELTTVAAVQPLTTLSFGEEDNKKETKVRLIETTINTTLTPGTPIISIFGELVGISTSVSRKDGSGSFVSFGDITNAVSLQAESQATTTAQTN